jgi:hypothetical protein
MRHGRFKIAISCSPRENSPQKEQVGPHGILCQPLTVLQGSGNALEKFHDVIVFPYMKLASLVNRKVARIGSYHCHGSRTLWKISTNKRNTKQLQKGESRRLSGAERILR